MATELAKAKKNVTKLSRKSSDLPLGISMLTLSGFRICQMSNRQLASTALLKRKSTG
ncbi:MAG: hypothetical protein K9L86_07695 [Candidatus Omnitrophica bacterium]|nr:hypothetical protein [Candidatus Omnitrophota bacterium]